MILAHALPQSVGAVPLTVILTALIGLYLGVSTAGARRAAALIGGAAPARRAVQDHDDPRPTVGQLLGLLGLVLVAVLATAGPTDAADNLTDAFVLVLLWGAVAISSMLAGGWWWRVDPLRGLTGLLSRLTGDPQQELAHPLPARTATAAAVLGLLTWAGVQLLVTASVLTFQLLLIAYVAVHVGGAARYGLAWLQQTEPLNVMSSVLGLLRPGGGGPVARLAALPDDDRLRWISATLIGWSFTDLVLETERWHDLGLSSSASSWAGLALLAASTGLMVLLIRLTSGRGRLGPAFVAVAGAWVFAHYLSLLLIEGQGVPIWLSDPFATGADLLGRADARVDLEPVPLDVLAALQAVPFVIGHLLAVAVTQRRAAVLARNAGQLSALTFPARAVIAVLLVGGIYLQLGGL